MTIFSVVLTAVVAQTAYQVDEAAGCLPVCVVISGAELARTVNVIVMTEDGCAVGMCKIQLN